MRSFIPALIGLATVAVAQNSTMDCVSSYTSCYDFEAQNANVCSSQATTCKDKCSTGRSNCLSSGTSSDVCDSRYLSCLGATSSSDASINCIAKIEPCYTNNGSSDNTCDSQIGNCKDACGAIRDICESSGLDNDVCVDKYNSCLGSASDSAPSDNCIAAAEKCYNDGRPLNECSAETASCKQKCGVFNDACQSSGDPSVVSGCQSSYKQCLGSTDLPKESSIDCMASAEKCYFSGEEDHTCDAGDAQCKDVCSNIFNTCNSSGDKSTDAACLTYYSSCLGATKYTSTKVDCVAEAEQCYLDGLDDNVCDAKNAACKNLCTRTNSLCGSSGDESVKGQCSEFYGSCLGSSELKDSTIDCVARNDECYLSGKSDNECDMLNANCKTQCSREMDTCTSSGDDSVFGQCQDHYNGCLGAKDVSPDSPVNCVSDATECFLQGTADNNCSASTAVCKTSCSRSYDTCLSSGDESVKPACLERYSTCLGATEQAEKAAEDVNCIKRYTDCFSSGVAENQCSADNAQCKNTCAQMLDSCSSSGNSATSETCQAIVNSCLGSIPTSLVDYKPLDCAHRYSQCSSSGTSFNGTASNGTAPNECDRQRASCKNACSTTLDTCLVSGTSDKAACNHLYMMCLDADSYTVTSIPPSAAPSTTRASYMVTPSANATSGRFAPSSGSASVATPAAYANGTAVDAQSGKHAESVAVESTVYVTDVVQTTVTTCPAGQTISASGTTTVLTSPSVITTQVTVKSTVSTTVAKTITVPAAQQTTSAPVNGEHAGPSTVILYSTNLVTITSCGPEVTNCPLTSTIVSTMSVPTGITITQVKSSSSSSVESPAPTAPSAVQSTITLYSTQLATITSCAEDKTDCPARSTVVSTSTIATGTTVTNVVPAQSTGLKHSTMILYSTNIVTVTKATETIVSTSYVPTGVSVTSVMSSAPVSSATTVPVVPVAPSSAPYGMTNGTMTSAYASGTVSASRTAGSTPSAYTGAASKAGFAGLAGVAAFAALLL